MATLPITVGWNERTFQMFSNPSHPMIIWLARGVRIHWGGMSAMVCGGNTVVGGLVPLPSHNKHNTVWHDYPFYLFDRLVFCGTRFSLWSHNIWILHQEAVREHTAEWCTHSIQLHQMRYKVKTPYEKNMIRCFNTRPWRTPLSFYGMQLIRLLSTPFLKPQACLWKSNGEN